MADENTPMICRKLRIYPNKQQLALFNKCLGTHRYFYNKANSFVKEAIQNTKEQRYQELQNLKVSGCVHTVKGKQCCKDIDSSSEFFCSKHIKNGTLGIKYSFLTLPSIRKAILTNDKDLSTEDLWQKEVPYDTRQLAIKQLTIAYKTCFASRKKGCIESFNIKFLSKKSTNQIFYVDGNAFNLSTMSLFTSRLKNKKVVRCRKRQRKKIKEMLTKGCDTVIMRTKPNQWYICTNVEPKDKTKSVISQPVYQNVFLDPGVRTFQTFYCPEGICGKIGDQYQHKHLMPLLLELDKITSLAAKTENKRTRYNLRIRCALLRTKIKNKIRDLHCKTNHFLCHTFQNIFLPHFEVQSMVSSASSVLNSKTVRNMMTLCHYEFKVSLQQYAKRHGRRVVLFNESFTTKVCDSCGHMNDVGGSKTFRCSSCNHTLDRDIHSGRCQCIKILTQYGSMVQGP
jgi:putative transposase